MPTARTSAASLYGCPNGLGATRCQVASAFKPFDNSGCYYGFAQLSRRPCVFASRRTASSGSRGTTMRHLVRSGSATGCCRPPLRPTVVYVVTIPWTVWQGHAPALLPTSARLAQGVEQTTRSCMQLLVWRCAKAGHVRYHLIWSSAQLLSHTVTGKELPPVLM